jgi:hypothetical protein
MSLYKISGLLTLTLVGSGIDTATAVEAKDTKNVVLTKAAKEKEAASPTKPDAKPSDAKPSDAKPIPTISDRKPGTITVKPLAMNFGALTFGMKHKSQIINGYPIDPYRSSFACLSNRGDSIGSSYDFELGAMVTKNIEVFTIVGIDHQNPNKDKSIISNNNPANQFDVFAYQFHSRRNSNISLGGRYYWDTQKPWFPFVGLIGTVIFQDSVRANIYNVINLNQGIYGLIGPLTLQEKKTLWGMTIQAGADYQFNDLVALTFAVGLQYTPRVPRTYPSIAGRQITCRDNRNLWTIPAMIALKFTF